MEIIFKILIIFILSVTLYVLIFRTLAFYGYKVGGEHLSMLSIDKKYFKNVVYDPINDYDINPDYHFKQMTKKWVFENNWLSLVEDNRFRFESSQAKETDQNRSDNFYSPDAVIFDGKKTVAIEFDEDGTFHTKRLNKREIEKIEQLKKRDKNLCEIDFLPPYTKKWKNYNNILIKAAKQNSPFCLVRVAYGPDKKSKGLTSSPTSSKELTKEINDFITISNINSREILKNDYCGELDNVYIKTLNYINNVSSEDISGKLILIYYDGTNRKIRSGIIQPENLSEIKQGEDYMLDLKWKAYRTT